MARSRKEPDQTTYTYGTEVLLTMGVVDAGWTFTGWSGGGCIGIDPCTVTMNADTTVTANFALNTFTLSYTAGTGGTLTGETSQTVNYGEDGTPVDGRSQHGLPLCELERRLDGQSAHGHQRHGECGRDGELCDQHLHPELHGRGGRDPDRRDAQTVNYGADGTAVDGRSQPPATTL